MEVMVQLMPVATAQFCCEACDHTGLDFECVDDEWNDEAWGQLRACERCGGVIPAERVELFPAVKLCVACQRAEEQGEPDQAEYCPRCGTVMVTKLRSGAGIAGYRLFCPECKR